MKQLLILIMLLAGFQGNADLQTTYRFTGRVTDEIGDGLPGVNVLIKGTIIGTQTDIDGYYKLESPIPNPTLVFSYVGFETQEVKAGARKTIDVSMGGATELQEVVVTGYTRSKRDRKSKREAYDQLAGSATGVKIRGMSSIVYENESEDYYRDEDYASISENGFNVPLDKPLSTFSIDVDAASYSNVRRFIMNGQLPPKDAVRVEEMINYFGYDYKNPKSGHPFSINTEVSQAPWNKKHLIAQIGIQGKKMNTEYLPPSNIVFLIDVSGSMSSHNKLPLLKSAFKLLVNEMRAEDKISIVVYAGAAGMVLPPTSGENKERIIDALDDLQAGGSTAGGAGINLAYQIARENFVFGGNNRVVLATDGDFNVGVSSNEGMEKLIEKKREEGVFLTVLGFGMGNYKDSKMEILADKGNGNYAYIDNLKEARKVLVNEFGGTMFTIAKDVKLQVEFNPANVQAYRLIGYENRKLNDEDFNDDKKDAGELGSGHTVTALYEIIPVGVKSKFSNSIDPLKYQTNEEAQTGVLSNELLTVKFRYKRPEGNKSKLITHVVENELLEPSDNMKWSMAVAGFGMLLRESEYMSKLKYEDVLSLAKQSKGEDEFGYRREFIELVELARGISPRQ